MASYSLFTPIRLSSGRPAPILLKGVHRDEVASLQTFPLMVTDLYSYEWHGDDFTHPLREVLIEMLPGFAEFKPSSEQPFFDAISAANRAFYTASLVSEPMTNTALGLFTLCQNIERIMNGDLVEEVEDELVY